jgi:pimeloyl-ACP methyl ester carboxylesterase
MNPPAPHRFVERTLLYALGFRSHHVVTSSGRVHVLERAGRGPNPTVVLLHGLASCGRDYLPLLLRVSPHVRRVLAPDLPWHGSSDRPAFAHDGEPFGRGLFEALDCVLDEPAIVFGNSIGGFAAIRYAAQRPERIRGLFLASPAGAPLSPAELERMRRMFRMETHGDALAFLDTVLFRPSPFRHVIALALRRRFRAEAIRTLLPRLESASSLAPHELATIEAPIRLLWGRGERLFAARQLAFFREHLPAQARIDEPSRMGHSPQLDDPREIAQRLVAFAREVETSA